MTTLTRIILPKRVINISNYLNSLRNSLVKKKLNLILNQNLQYPHTPKKETRCSLVAAVDAIGS